MNNKLFTIIFVILVGIELFLVSNEAYTKFRFVTKPAIVGSLLIYFLANAKTVGHFIKLGIALALFFSILGDILLLLVDRSEHFFTAGLVSFLLAHVLYIMVFLKDRNPKRNPLVFIIMLLVYASGLFYLLKDGLGAMLIPVIVYMLVILSMATSAFLRKHKVSSLGYTLVFVGAIFFMISDSMLAINKFHNSFYMASLGIMATYAIAQYLIVFGILESYKKS